jgi:hypothetical protein
LELCDYESPCNETPSSSAREGIRGQRTILIPLKNPMNASTRLSMNGKSSIISTALPFVLRLSKDERRVFQQNLFCFKSSRDGARNYSYDTLNRLVEALNPLPSNPQEGYVYDPVCSFMGSL